MFEGLEILVKWPDGTFSWVELNREQKLYIAGYVASQNHGYLPCKSDFEIKAKKET